MPATATTNIDLQAIATSLDVSQERVRAAVELLDAGNTVPFIARYRKEQTGSLDDEQLRQLADQLTKQRALAERRDEVLRLLAEHGHLDAALEAEVQQAQTLQRLEDLYRPFRPKRKTRASVARQQGLEPLAAWLCRRMPDDPAAAAKAYLNDEVPDVESALQGARDIVAETLSDAAAVRAEIRRITRQTGSLHVAIREHDRADHYRAYQDFAEPVRRIPPHRILAVNRGEREEALKVSVIPDTERCLSALQRAVLRLGIDNGIGGVPAGSTPAGGSGSRSSAASAARASAASSADTLSPSDVHLNTAAQDAYKRLIAPAIEREVRSELTAAAEEQALKVFRANLRSLLLQPPLRDQVMMGLDPAFRTGVKVAVVDATGRLLETSVIYPNAPQNKTQEAARILTQLVERHGVTAVAIGNGTASRETEAFVAEWLQQIPNQQRPGYCIVDEAGASVYSASALAHAEFPNLDVSERSAVSIARRLQDPLAELVKIEPRSLGVGQYQHDVDQKRLAQELTGVVEGTVNQVGVDLNTASVPLLAYVAGLSTDVAQRVVTRRDTEGPFRNRKELLVVSRLGPRAFEQCAGFLRITGGTHPLDRTPIHPESYAVATALLERLELSLDQVGAGDDVQTRLGKLAFPEIRQLAGQLDCGEPTLFDIVEALKRPGRDPREDLPPPLLRADVLDMDDLHEGMVLGGTVRNVVDFGAFVDIGVKQDGLVHLSELADQYVNHPLDVVAVGQSVRVRVLTVDKQRGRIGLSLKGIPTPSP